MFKFSTSISICLLVSGLTTASGITASAQMCSTTGQPGILDVASLTLAYDTSGALSARSINALTAITDSSVGQQLTLDFKSLGKTVQTYQLTPGTAAPSNWLGKIDIKSQPQSILFSEVIQSQPLTISYPYRTKFERIMRKRFVAPPSRQNTMGPTVDVDALPERKPKTPACDEAICSIGLPVGDSHVPSTEGTRVHSPPAPMSSIEVKEIQKKIAESVVLITFKVTAANPEAPPGIGFCNGTNLGTGRILTNAHCFKKGSFDHIVWFGKIEWTGAVEDGPMRSALACQGTRIDSFAPKSPINPALQLDLALIQLPTEQIQGLDDRFLSSVVTLPDSDIWCGSDHKCKPPQNFDKPGQMLSVAQVWSASRTDVLVSQGIPDYRPGIKTISKNVGWLSCAASSHGTLTVNSRLLSQACAYDDHLEKWTPPISSYGFVHNCDTMPGASGAPVFRQSDLDTFFSQRTNYFEDLTKIPLTGVHRAGMQDRGNCAIPASLIKGYIPP